MILKRIEIQGFKSFADRLTLDFEDGLTGIVGPNGCGKSNVVDAIRWALGEQSSKTLRGDNMQDIIFSGTTARKSMSYCEVTLVFDNTERIFELELDEIAVTRKVYRGSGESEYFINRSPSLLKSVHNLFRNTGIGKEGYSIVGQGQIQGIFRSKPQERRGIFEDAAGISKHKANKKEAERKLERTEDNLEKLNLILNELKDRLGPLEKQAENARKFVELREKLKYSEVNMFLAQVENNAEEKKRIGERLTGIAEEQLQREADALSAESEYKEKLQQATEADLQVGALHKQQIDVVTRLKAKEGDVNLHAARLEFNRGEEVRLTAELKAAEAELERAKAAAAEAENTIAQTKILIEAAEAEQLKAEDERVRVTGLILEREQQRERENEALMASLTEAADAKISLAEIKTRLESLQERISETAQDKERERLAIEGAEAEKQAVESNVLKLKSRVKQLQGGVQSAIEKFNNLGLLVQQFNQKLRELSSAIGAVDAKRKLLERQKENFEGFSFAVRNLLQKRKSEPAVASAIDAVAAEVLKVPDKLTTAIEVALGGSLQDIITKDVADARFLIEYLRKHDLGAATFRPLTEAKPRGADGNFEELKRARGCLGAANELVQFDKKYYNVFSGLLGGTLIFEDFDTAQTAAKMSGYRYKIVTLLGDVFMASSISGGSRKRGNSDVLRLDKEIEQTKAQFEQYDAEYKAKINEIQALEQQRADTEAALSKSNAELKQQEVALSAEEERLSNAVAAVEEHSANYKKLGDALALFEAQQLEFKARLQVADKQTAQKTQQTAKKAEPQADGLQELREQINGKITAIKVKIATHGRDYEVAEHNLSRSAGAVAAMQAQLEAGGAALTEIRAKIAAAETAINDIADADELAALNKEITAKVEKLTALKQKLAEAADAANTKKEDCLKVLASIKERRAKEEAALERIEEQLAQKSEYIHEEYGLTYQEALPQRDPEFEVYGAATEIANLKRSISRLGPVNPGAIEEFREVGERYEAMNVQVEDLEQAKAHLLQLIKEISDEMLQIFEREFKKINAHFKVIFKELFGGGNGELVMNYDETDDPLEAGVDIKAKPPARAIEKISLLSGGEQSLTSIAIVLAILKVRKTPFCVFDECEAALDESNAALVAKYMKRYSKETQFICITHKKATMEEADRLYGVTMEEPGVSKMVSVKIEEAVKHAASEAK